MVEVHPQWMESAEVKQALDRMGGAAAALADPVRLLELVGEIREAAVDPRLTSWLNDKHLSLAEVTELVSTVAVDEPPADLNTRVAGLRAPGTRAAVTTLYLRGVEPDVIARILDLPEAHVVAYLVSRGASPAERDAVNQHYAGATVTQIADNTGLSRMGIYKILERLGVEPNREVPPTPPSRAPARIISLRQQGKSYAEIRELTGATTNQIRMALRSGAAKGLLPNYGKSVAS